MGQCVLCLVIYGIILRKTVDNNQLTEWINGINSFEVAKVSEIFGLT
jgi:hypothetical protein